MSVFWTVAPSTVASTVILFADLNSTVPISVVRGAGVSAGSALASLPVVLFVVAGNRVAWLWS